MSAKLIFKSKRNKLAHGCACARSSTWLQILLPSSMQLCCKTQEFQQCLKVGGKSERSALLGRHKDVFGKVHRSMGSEGPLGCPADLLCIAGCCMTPGYHIFHPVTLVPPDSVICICLKQVLQTASVSWSEYIKRWRIPCVWFKKLCRPLI